ncbi:MAG: helix-turn-helix domain-containing protein [Oscillospiraceae bacterium]|nr:helix-turn-helix domain-containing protein [Oscillospiraceae bacterium]
MPEHSERLLKAINDAGYSYGELARLTGIPKSAIQRYATGVTEKIPSDRVALLAHAVGVPAAYLMGFDDGQAAAVPVEGLDPVADRAFFEFMSEAKREGLCEKDLALIMEFIKRVKAARATDNGL